MKKSVLLLDGQAVQTLIVARMLKKSGYRISVLADGKDNYGYHTSSAMERYVGPDSHHKEEYHDYLMSLLSEHHFDVLIPMTDETAHYCSIYKADIIRHSQVLIPELDVFMRGYDKSQLMSLCGEKGYPHPQTKDLGDAQMLDAGNFETFPFPALIKPNLTTGGRGMTLVASLDELMKVYPGIYQIYGACHLQQFIEPGGRQIKVQVMTDATGKPAYSSVIWKQRYYPVNGGSSCCNVTIDNPEIANMCGKILQDIGWVGFADFDLIENPHTGQLLVMEMNPRIPACVRSAVESGMDYATMIADATLGHPLQHYSYTSGKSLRHLGFEVLWFLQSPNRWKTKPCWFQFFGRNIYYQDLSWQDLIPFIHGTWGNIKKQLDPEFRKAKAGVNVGS